MSTGLSCQVVEWKPGKWYYVLEQGSAPKEAWDWREYADAYGPYSNEGEALRELRANHANPGGHWTLAYDPKREKDEVLAGLVARAKKHDGLSRLFGFSFGSR
jgi:hypothetical protein